MLCLGCTEVQLSVVEPRPKHDASHVVRFLYGCRGDGATAGVIRALGVITLL